MRSGGSNNKEQFISPQTTPYQTKFLSPQIDRHCYTEPSVSEGKYHYIGSPNGNTDTHHPSLEPTAYSGYDTGIKSSNTPQSRPNKTPQYFHSQQKDPQKSTKLFEATEENPRAYASDGYYYLRVPDLSNYESSRTQRPVTRELDNNNTNKSERKIYADLNNFQQQEPARKPEVFSRANLFLSNITRSGLTVPTGPTDLYSPSGRTVTVTSPTSSTENSRAYAKAMRALQDKNTFLEEQVKKLEEGRKDDKKEWREIESKSVQLEHGVLQARNKSIQDENLIKELEKENRNLRGQVDVLQREKEMWDKEKEEFIKEKEAILREKEQLEREKEDWARLKEVYDRRLTEKEREKSETEKRNEQAVENVRKLEKDFSEYKKMYHQHLKSMVLKNEALVMEAAQVKEYYNGQIQDFEKELISIEEEQKRKMEDYLHTIDELTKRNRELEELFQLKQKESDNLKRQLDTDKSHNYDMSISRRVYSVPDEATPFSDVVLQDPPKKRKQHGLEEFLGTNSSISNVRSGRERQTYSEGFSSERREKLTPEPKFYTEVSSFLQNGRESRESAEKKELSEGRPGTPGVNNINSGKSPKAETTTTITSSVFEATKEEIPRETFQKERKKTSQFGNAKSPRSFGGGESTQEKIAKLLQTASSIGRIEEKEDEEQTDGGKPMENDALSKYLHGDSPNTKGHQVFIEPIQDFQEVANHQGRHSSIFGEMMTSEKNDMIDTAGFPKNQSFGNIEIMSSRANSLDSSKHGIISFNSQNAKRAQDLASIREQLVDKERDLSQANQQYQDLMQKIKEATNSTEKSKMRGNLIELHDEIQKIHEQIIQLKKQEATM